MMWLLTGSDDRGRGARYTDSPPGGATRCPPGGATCPHGRRDGGGTGQGWHGRPTAGRGMADCVTCIVFIIRFIFIQIIECNDLRYTHICRPITSIQHHYDLLDIVPVREHFV